MHADGQLDLGDAVNQCAELVDRTADPGKAAAAVIARLFPPPALDDVFNTGAGSTLPSTWPLPLKQQMARAGFNWMAETDAPGTRPTSNMRWRWSSPRGPRRPRRRRGRGT